MPLTLIALAALSHFGQADASLSFGELEKRKYEAFAALHSFRGRYSIVTSKPDGTALTEDLVYQFGPKGRQMLMMANAHPLMEMGWNDSQVWKVSYGDHTYTVTNTANALDRKPFEKLAAPKNQLSFSAADTGIRFGIDPEPPVTGPIKDKDGDKDLDKYTVTANDPDKGAVAVVSQWCDSGTFLVRKFEIRVTLQDKPQMLVQGVLFDDDERAVVPPTVGDLPLELLRNFRKLG